MTRATTSRRDDVSRADGHEPLVAYCVDEAGARGTAPYWR